MQVQEFSFGNFKSFKDIQTLNLSAAKIKSKNPKIDKDNLIFHNDKVSLLKSKAIYGANASGKSNVIQALLTFIRVTVTSVKDEEVLSWIDIFRLSTETKNTPVFFQLIFWDKGIKYRYGFELDDNKIFAEWLYATPNKRELPYFIRDGQEIIKMDETNFREGYQLSALFNENSEGNSVFRTNSLFLTSLSLFGFGKLSKELIENISSIIVIGGLADEGMYQLAANAIENKEQKKYIIDFLKLGDTGIEDIRAVEVSIDNLPNDRENSNENRNKLLISSRKRFNKNLEFEGNEPFSFITHESEGTQKLFELAPFIYKALKSNRVILIDEFDARFHPLLTKKIVELFNSSDNLGAQLVFVTHDTNLLSSDLLRRDQVEFVEKDKYGASHLYSLVEFKGIRNTDSFEKDYIQGKYGAIPFLGDFSKLINTEEDA